MTTPEPEITPNNNAPAPRRVRWRHSIFFRTILLCAILLLCLLGSVIVISRYYFQEAVQEMEVVAAEIADSIVIELEATPEIDLESLETKIMDLHKGYDIEIQPYTGGGELDSYTLKIEKDGSLQRIAHVPMQLGDQYVRVTTTVTIAPLAEVLRAFKNKYMLALTTVFVLTLGLMVYFIAKTLRPLTQLTDTCAAISTGNLNSVSTRGAAGEILALEETFNNMVKALREKELVEAKLRQAQRLSALGNLAAGIAHDVRNPLNAIKLLSSHALDSVGDGPAAKSLATIRDEVDRLEGIVSSFLSLGKETALSPEPGRVDDLLEDCLRLFQKDAEDRGIRLTGELRAGDTTLMLDRKQWSRAILNVLLNALEACPPGGRVRLFSRCTDSACEIEIRDDGPGLSAEAREHVFDPYYTTKPGGTGLGLSLTRGIVEEHGGTVDIASTEGHGCQVLIRLPHDKTLAR